MTRAEKLTKWIKALRSGRYKQTTGALVDYEPDKKKACYCCLGVADKILKEPRKGNVPDASYPELAFVLGITKIQEDKLIMLNDTNDRNFSQIADHIEKYILRRKAA